MKKIITVLVASFLTLGFASSSFAQYADNNHHNEVRSSLNDVYFGH